MWYNISMAEKPKQHIEGNERQSKDLQAVDRTLSNADNLAGTKLKKEEMQRTAAIVQVVGGEMRYTPEQATKNYRNEVEDSTLKDSKEYIALSNKIIEQMKVKAQAVENVFALIEKHKAQIPAQYKPVVDAFLKTAVDPVTNKLTLLDGYNTSKKNVEDQLTLIQGIIQAGQDKDTVRAAINKIWVIADLPSGTGKVDTGFNKEVDMAVMREHAKQVASVADALTATINTIPLNDILFALQNYKSMSDQEQRDIILTQQTDRAKFLNRIAGTPTAEQLLKEATVEVTVEKTPPTMLAGVKVPGTATYEKKSRIDVAYLAYCIRYASDAKKGATQELKDLQEHLGIADTDLFIDPATADLQTKIDEYLKESIPVPNPAGVDVKNLLVKMNFSEDIAKVIEQNPELRENVPLRTLFLFRGTKVNGLVSARSSIAKMIQDKKIAKEDLINVLTLLQYPFKKSEKGTWDATKVKSETLYQKLIAAKAISEDKNKVLVLNDQAKMEEQFPVGTFDANIVVDIANKISAEQPEDLPWEKDVEFMMKPVGEVAANGFKYWLAYVKKIPDDFKSNKPGDKELVEAILKSDIIKEATKAFTALKQDEDADKKPIVQSEVVKKAIEENEKKKTELAKPTDASGRVLAQNADAQNLVKISRYVHKQLNAMGLENRPREQQDIAFWLAMHKDLNTARAYLNMKTPDVNQLVGFSDADKVNLGLYVQQLFVNEHLRGTDILGAMKFKLGLTLNPLALKVMETELDTLGVPLSAGPARMEEWFNAPEKAGPSLDAILEGEPGAKAALITAFTTNTPQQYGTVTGETRTIDPVEARTTVQHIMQHLTRQKEDYGQSVFHSQRKLRYADPLDVLRNGKDSLMGMLYSNDKIQQGIAITLMVSAGCILYRTWTRGGAFGKGLVMSIPLFFGSDAVLRKMTGEGILDRLGMQYMNEKDRSTAVEQFRRKYEKDDKYSFLRADTGHIALRELMKENDNPMKKIRVEQLINWRMEVGKTAEPNFRGTLPDSLKESMLAVKAKIPLGERNNTKADQREEKASEYLYRAFEALCIDVAERNNLPEPKAVNGAALIHKRYVTFDDKTVYGENGKRVKEIADKKGGLTMLDVLVYERPTPATQELLLQNDTFLEWVLRGTGITVEAAKRKLSQNMSLAQIYAEHGMQVAPEYLEMAQTWLNPKAKAMYEYLRLVSVKNYAALKAEGYAALNLASNTLTQLGVIITEGGPDVIKWTWETGTYVGRKGVDALQNTYRILHKNGFITGPTIDFFDGISLAMFGTRLSDLALWESAMDSNDPEALNTHVEKLSDETKWKKEFETQLNAVSSGATEGLIGTWIKEAEALVKPAAVSTGNETYKKMMAYELVKRRVYSYILAKGGNKGSKIPFTNETLARMEADAKNIENVYGLVALRLLNAERNDWSVEKWDYLPDIVKPLADVLLNKIPQSTIQREDARQYLVGLEEFYTEFRRSALQAFPDEKGNWNDGKLKQYDAFLQTVLTNAVIDMTLNQTAGQEAAAGGMARTKALPTEQIARPFELQIAQAQNFLTFLRAERGNSPDAMKLKDMNFAAFTQNGDIENLNAYIPQIQKKLAPPPKPGQPLTAPQVNDIKAALASGIHDAPTLERLLPGLNADAGTDVNNAVLQKFDALATELLGLSKQEIANRKDEALVVLQGTNQRKALRDKLFESVEEVGLAEAAAAFRDKGAYAPDALTDLIDRTAVSGLNLIVNEMKTVAVDDISLKNRTQRWDEKLIRLYKSTKNPKVRDVLSQALEFVKYQIKHNADAENGKTGYAKYAAFLKERGMDEPPEENGWYISLNSKQRMAINSGASTAFRDTWGISGINNRSSSILDKTQILVNEILQ